MVIAKKFIYVKKFDGFPKESDVKIVEEELPPIKNGEFLCEAVYISVDPYVRAFSAHIPTGTKLIGSQIAKVIESKNPKYKVGQYVVGELGWTSHAIADETSPYFGFPKPWIIPDPEGLPLSYSLSVLGMPGATAYFGFLEICKPKPGETVIITGAAGAVGSIVGQIAKIKGCTVIGITGSDEKGEWLKHELNFDHFVNYKDPDFEKKLEKAASNGIDCFFDNVGGELCNTIMKYMNSFGRVSICGQASSYNDNGPPKVTQQYELMMRKQLKMEGFTADRWMDKWPEAFKQHKKWIKEGKLKYKETVTSGFENVFKAFCDMLRAVNAGKVIVKI